MASNDGQLAKSGGRTRADQAWVTVTQYFANGQQAGLGYEAIRFDNACTARHSGL